MLDNAVGRPVTGESFYDRASEVRTLWTRLETDDILLLAPRRVGKTSLMRHLRDTASAHGFQAMYVSVADATTEIGFIRKLLAEIEKHGEKKRVRAALKKSPVARLFRRVRGLSLAGFGFELADGADDHWQAIGESIASALSSLGGKWLLLIDEVPIFVLALLKKNDGDARTRAFLNWFRDLRQNVETNGRVRWFLAGSIGLDTVTRRMALGDTINDLFIYDDFGPFDKATALSFLDALAASHDVALNEGVKARICELTSWLIPYHLQLWFAELREVAGMRPATVDDVNVVYEKLLSAGKKAYFDYWHQRLREELGTPDDGYAAALLNAIAADPRGTSEQTLTGVLASRIQDSAQREERLRYLLDVLLADGYIVQADARYIFRSSLLAEFWRRHIA